MKKLLIISLIGLGLLSCHSSKTENTVSPYPQLRLPRCKNEVIRKQEYDKFIEELREQGYTIKSSVTDDMNFTVYVDNPQGNREVKTKQWCRIGE